MNMNPTDVSGFGERGPQRADLQRMRASRGPSRPSRGRKVRDIFHKPKGCVEIVARNVKTGQEKVLVDDQNLVVTVARHNMSRLIAGAYTDAAAATTFSELKSRVVTKMSWGTGGHVPSSPTTPIPPTAADVALASEIGAVGKKALDSYDFPNSTTVRFIGSLDESEANGEGISEAGLWTEDDPNNPGSNLLFARKTFGLITKTSDFIFEFRWRIIF